MMIQSVMLVALGALGASLVAIILAPSLWGRAVRLTTDRMRASLPLTLSEIRADKDQLRANFAIKIRRFEVALENAKLDASRQLVEISRRESQISALDVQLEEMQRSLEEQKSANSVLQKTISVRIPRLESQLSKAKDLLGARYNEITQLRSTLNRQEGQLGKAETVSQLRKAEVDRLKLALGSAAKEEVVDPRVEHLEKDLEAAKARNENLEEQLEKLKSEIMELRAHGSAVENGVVATEDPVPDTVEETLASSADKQNGLALTTKAEDSDVETIKGVEDVKNVVTRILEGSVLSPSLSKRATITADNEDTKPQDPPEEDGASEPEEQAALEETSEDSQNVVSIKQDDAVEQDLALSDKDGDAEIEDSDELEVAEASETDDADEAEPVTDNQDEQDSEDQADPDVLASELDVDEGDLDSQSEDLPDQDEPEKEEQTSRDNKNRTRWDKGRLAVKNLRPKLRLSERLKGLR